MESTPTLETSRLILRRFTERDVSAFYDILSDREVNTFLPWFPLTSLEEAEKRLHEHYLSAYLQPDSFHYAICLRENNIPIGYLNVSNCESRDFGYGLHRKFWNRGIVTEAGRAVINRLRNSCLPYITATHDVNNPRSGAVMKKLGMTYRYSYREQWQPKNIPVVFRLYQLNFKKPQDFIYKKYWNESPVHFVENDL